MTNGVRRTQAYVEYMRSPDWRAKRQEVIRNAGYRCQRCGSYAQPLHVHHLTYEFLGDEPLEDLEALCGPCHGIADAQREYEEGLWTFATKKYGKGWSMRIPIEVAEGEFADWLESKDDNNDGEYWL